MNQAHLVFVILGLTLAGFAWGRVRYDLVSMLALLAAVLVGVVPQDQAFSGFGHPAVITVVAVLVLSKALQQAGLVDLIAGQTRRVGGNIVLQLLVLTVVVATLSAFMNNVGALALLLPVALRMAREHRNPPSLLLMPLAFGSLLGGLLTLVGTPPNIIISSYRAEYTGQPFSMFSFLPVGGSVALAGLAFMVLLGWRLVPRRKAQTSSADMFKLADYTSELEVVPDSRAVGRTLRDLREEFGGPVPVVAVLRENRRRLGHRFEEPLREGDVLVVEANPEELKVLETSTGLRLAGGEKHAEKLADMGDLQLVEAVVGANSQLIGRTVGEMRLLDRRRLLLLAVARQGGRLTQRLNRIRLQAGDVLLLQGDEKGMFENLAGLGCLPLAERNLELGQPRRLVLSVVIFAGAVTAMVLGWLSAPVAVMLAAVASVLAGVLPLREVYRAIDWPIIVLLAAMLPLGQAFETSGGAHLVADGIFAVARVWPPAATLALLMIITLLLSNLVNNAAAALLAAPIAHQLALGLGVSADPYLMAAAIGASSAFLTPIGHQSATLVMGPGGYRFGDYWKLGLPLSVIVVVTAVPLILWVWPL
ncbi:MAG: SLC13 family permease [Candidatus Krumholzibacteriia bacterium]